MWEPNGDEYAGDVFIIGGGPSLAGFDWSRLAGRETLGINTAFKLGADLVPCCFFGDHAFYLKNAEELRRYEGLLVTNGIGEMGPPVLRMPRIPDGLMGNGLGWNHSSGAAAIHLALLMGAKRVLLLGYDGLPPPGKPNNWHADGPSYTPSRAAEVYRQFTSGFQRMARDLPLLFPRTAVINLNPDSMLRVFPIQSPDDFL